MTGDLLRALNGVGVVTLCLLYIIGLIRGWHVLGRDHRALVARLDAQLAVKDEQIAAQGRQLAIVSDVGETVNAVMSAIQQTSSRGTAGSDA